MEIENKYKDLLDKLILDAKINIEDLQTIKKNITKYLSCIVKWGAVHNIVSSKLKEEDLWLNILDSLMGASVLELVLDVHDAGSGGGFPALPLAICFPGINITLVEASRKKCSFLRLVRSELDLKNVTIKNCRIEDLPPNPMVISKAAFSSGAIQKLLRFCHKDGKLALWTTPKSEEDLVTGAKNAGAILEKRLQYELPKGGQRLILVFVHKN